MIRHLRSHLIAYLALFVALSGGSFAVAALNRHDKRVVKKIVNKQITRRAGGLSVANAASAQNAENAGQLGGSPPGAFQQRVTGSCADNRTISAIAASGAVSCGGAVVPVDLSGPAVSSGFPTMSLGDLEIKGLCKTIPGPAKGVIFTNVGSTTATLNWLYSTGTIMNVSGEAIGPSQEKGIFFDLDGHRLEGQFIFSSPGGKVTLNVHAFGGFTLDAPCEIFGTAIFAPTS